MLCGVGDRRPFLPFEGWGQPPCARDVHSRRNAGVEHMCARAAISGGRIDRRSMTHPYDPVVLDRISAGCILPCLQRMTTFDKLGLARCDVGVMNCQPLIDNCVGICLHDGRAGGPMPDRDRRPRSLVPRRAPEPGIEHRRGWNAVSAHAVERFRDRGGHSEGKAGDDCSTAQWLDISAVQSLTIGQSVGLLWH